MDILFSFVGMDDLLIEKDDVYYEGPLLTCAKRGFDCICFVETQEVQNFNRNNIIRKVLQELYPKAIIRRILFTGETYGVDSFSRFIENSLYDLRDEFLNYNPEFYFNLSSGTTQMILSMSIIASYVKDLKINKLQFNYPFESNYNNFTYLYRTLNEEQILELCNPNIESQITIVDKNSFGFKSNEVISLIEAFVQTYDYNNAYRVLNENKTLFNECEAFLLLEKLKYLISLDFDSFSQLEKHDDFYYGKLSQDYYYYLYLKTKIKFNKLLEFSRGVGPLIENMFFNLLYLFKYDIDALIKDIDKCSNDDELNKCCMKYFGGNMNYRSKIPIKHFKGDHRPWYHYSTNTIILLKIFNQEKQIFTKQEVENLSVLKDYISTVRNLCSHEIIKLDSKLIEVNTKVKFDRFNEILEKTLNKISNLPLEFNLYDNTNELIIDLLRRNIRGGNF